MEKRFTIPTNPNAQDCVKKVMDYLGEISGDRIVTGQHTQTMDMVDLEVVRKETGKEPALLGFELLSYSPNINYLDTDKECMTEVTENYGTLKRAWEWAERKGLITFTWHWFSPMGGRSKAFFSENTEFDAAKAATAGTPEYEAMISDMDVIAGILRPFCDMQIPILWRPFHEGDGVWFWWGAKGAEPVKKLWRIMYERFTGFHHLNNLIWVWNSPKVEFYPGDDTVDIISCDIYAGKQVQSNYSAIYKELSQITSLPKIAVIGETGCLPDPNAIHEKKVPWASFMTWSRDFCRTEEYNSFDYLRQVYNSPYAVTKEQLPELY
jgi:mannan endo-1,4-beta-mannosidase